MLEASKSDLGKKVISKSEFGNPKRDLGARIVISKSDFGNPKSDLGETEKSLFQAKSSLS